LFRRGSPIELADAEFHGLPDQTETIVRGWLERDGVAVILDVPGIAAAIRIQKPAQLHDHYVMNTGSFSDAPIGAACSPTATHWLEKSRALTMAMTLGLVSAGMRTLYLVAPSDVMGVAFLADSTAAFARTGGRLVGVSRHPADATTFLPALGGALNVGADAVGLCAMGTSLQIQIREARDIGLFSATKAVCAYAGSIRDIHNLGARDLWLVGSFHWNESDRACTFGLQFNRLTGHVPDKPQAAATYASIGHILSSVESLDTIEGAALSSGLRGTPVRFFGANGQLRTDGALLLNVSLFQVKQPDEIMEDWEYYDKKRLVMAMDAVGSVGHAVCPLSI
jgi:branched-chain amino acid transport system substrate-binding protein